MAKCKRCGTSFDYDKREGVCPKCCFYNRPPGMPYHDDDWIESYNIEENTYELPKSILETEEEDPGRLFRRRQKKEKEISQEYRESHRKAKECHTEGSHVHKASGTTHSSRSTSKRRSASKKLSRPGVFAVTVIIAAAVIYTMNTHHNFSVPAIQKDFEVHEASYEELQGGLKIGDLSFTTDDQGAVVLFEEGQLPELPAGEKCIGILLSDDESHLEYEGIDWDRPYVYDGTSYRELVDPESLDSYDQFDSLGTDFMWRYLSSYSNFEGMAVFFVDQSAESVKLCIPDQTLDGQKVYCQGVTEIAIPVTAHKLKEVGQDEE